MIARTHTMAVVGLEPHPVEVEVDVGNGMPHFQIVGLPDAAVSESRERVRSALRSSGLGFPGGRITVNLAPADLKKEGPGFDLPIALAIAAADGKVAGDGLAGVAALGELSLDGRVRGIPGILSAAIHHRRLRGGETLLIPGENEAEARQVRGLRYVAVATLSEAKEVVEGARRPVTVESSEALPEPEGLAGDGEPDFAEVRGQTFACRALQIVAAGGHNAVLVGPPGSGKTMVAHRLPSIMPPLSDTEAFEVTQIYSVAGLLPAGQGLIRRRPFRAPHHSCSAAGLIGGGSHPRPGEISLAHCGALFLDEALEFPRSVLETLRQPLESGTIALSRAQTCVAYPARIMLVLALNPCPCGYYGDAERPCACPPTRVQRYRSRLSGPLLDRIDLHHEMPRRPWAGRDAMEAAPPSRELLAAVLAARERQARRFRKRPPALALNARMGARDLHAACAVSEAATGLLRATAERLGWSRRAHDRVLRVARTIADLEGSAGIEDDHLLEAIAHRRACFGAA